LSTDKNFRPNIFSKKPGSKNPALKKLSIGEQETLMEFQSLTLMQLSYASGDRSGYICFLNMQSFPV